MRRLIKYLFHSLRSRRDLNRLLRLAIEGGAKNPDADPAPMLLPGSTVFRVRVAYCIDDRHRIMTLHLRAHPKNPRSVLIATALRLAASQLPKGAHLRLATDPTAVCP